MCTLLVKETVNYYTHNSSSVYCCLLDATKAFDRINYNKLFNLLIHRNLPSVVVRLLINLYTTHKLRIMWNGAFSEIIYVKNGVKQGGILSPILFCVYLDNLILSLVNSGVGCYMGHICLSVLAYADDVVILAPTASAMRKLLAICDGFANDYDVKFNASKTKCILFQPACCNKMSCNAKPVFSIQNNNIEFVDSWPHLGHIINNKLNDCDDIINRRNILLGQINDLLCYFGKLNPVVKTSLLYSYCSNLYGCELWDLTSTQLSAIGLAWRKAMKRVWLLPLGTHAHACYVLALW